jgi:pimeloyl-ACP methyl ester carboxylesterase
MEQTIQKSIAVERSSLSVDVYGDPDGPAVVVVPGVMSDARAWGGIARRLDGWSTVVVVNRRGRRPSGPLTDGYRLETEVADAAAVLDEFSDVRTLFGWSYGGLITLELASVREIPHVIAYEPIMAPFGAEALPALHTAQDAGDLDQMLEIALLHVTGMDHTGLAALRADSKAWEELRRLSAPLHAETLAINQAPSGTELGARSPRVDLIIGERNRGKAPYGSSFADVTKRVTKAAVHQLDGQAHLAHLEAPDRLADLVNRLHASVH